MSLDSLAARIQHNLDTGLETHIGADGSAFDSTQHLELMEKCDDPVIQVICDHMEFILMNSPQYDQADVSIRQELAHDLRRAMLRHTFEVLYPAPDHGAHFDYTPAQKRCFRDFKIDERDGIVLTMNGTVASGHPCTTLMNTLRQLSYSLFYAWEAGIDAPWLPDNGKIDVMASGDDQMTLCLPQYRTAICNAMRLWSANNKLELQDGRPRGNG